MNTKHATLSKDGLLWIENSRWKQITDEPFTGLSSLCEIAVTYKFTHLWVMDINIVPDRAWFESALSEWDLFATWGAMANDAENVPEEAQEVLVSCTGCKRPKGGQHWFNIAFPLNSQWSWADDNLTPKLLLQIIKYEEEALGIEIGSGPTTAGMRLLSKLHEKHPDWLAGPGMHKCMRSNERSMLASLPFGQAARDIIWSRDLTDDERQPGLYLHKYDKNSAYLRSCQEERMGIGVPVHVFRGPQNFAEVGIWHLSRIHPDRNYAWRPAPLWRDCEWVSTPIVKMLDKMGYELIIDEGYVFLRSEKILKPWAETLWNARQSFKQDDIRWKHRQAAELARDGIKDIATSTVGLFQTDNEDVRRTWKFRPDWHAQVVGGVRSLMMYNILKYAEKGYYPCMVYMDALFYVTDSPEPIPDILEHKDSLGGYKHEWTLPCDDEDVAEILRRDSMGLATKLELLNERANELGV